MNETENNSNTHYIYVEKKDGCLTKGIKLGCGVIIAMHIMVFIMCFALGFCKGSSDDKEALSSPVQYFQVTNGKKEVTIHTGMPRDSVILLLGQPTELTVLSIMTEYLTVMENMVLVRRKSNLTMERFQVSAEMTEGIFLIKN